MTAKTALTRSVSQLKLHQIMLINVLLHHLNNTHLLAQLTRTLNCKHCLQYILALVLAYALCVTFSYSYSSLPGISLCGTFAPRSENTGDRKVPEPSFLQWFQLATGKMQIAECGKLPMGKIWNTSAE